MKQQKKKEQLKKWYKEGMDIKRFAPQKGIELAENILSHSIEPKYSKYQVLGTLLKALCLNALAKNDEALKYFNKAQQLHREHLPQDKKHLRLITMGKGLVYWQKGNNQLAINLLLRCLSLGKESEMGGAYINLGLIYAATGDNNKAIEYLQKAKIITKTNNTIDVFVSACYNLIPRYISLNKINAAKQEAFKVLDLIEQHPDKIERLKTYKVTTTANLGEIYLIEQDLNKALQMQKQALRESREISDAYLSSFILSSIADIYIEKKCNKKALRYMQEALHCANEAGLKKNKQKILEQIIQYYKDTKQLAAAFPFYEMLYELSQEQLIESRDENLQKIVADREQEIQILEEKNKEIEEQNAILKQFTYIISHDLREPIRGITGFASLLNKKYAENLDETANEYLQFILSEANSMNRNLARLLKYTTIEKGINKVKEVDISQIITELKYKYQKESFELNITCKGEPLKMQPKHAKLLLEELIDNAVQFKKENETCRVEIQNELKEGYYHLSVKDYGIGIDAAYHDKVFKIFNKINKLKGSGAGVGLAICQRIVQLYKGQISVESAPNQFSTFCIKIAA